MRLDRYAHFHQMVRQLRDSREAMFLCQIDLGLFGRFHACAVCLTKVHMSCFSSLANLLPDYGFFLDIFFQILSEGLEQVKFPNITEIQKVQLAVSKLRLTM